MFVRQVFSALILPFWGAGFICVSSVGAAQEPTQSVDEPKNRFLREAPGKWQEAEALLNRLDAKCIVKITTDGKLNADQVFEVRQNSECRLYVMSMTLPKMYNRVGAYNPLYSFVLTKTAPDSAWLLTSLALGSKKKSASAEIDEMVPALHFHCPVRLGGTPLRELIKQPSFRVNSVRAVETEHASLMEVSFSNEHSRESRPFCAVQSGRLYLDPSRYWCLNSAEVETQYATAGGKAYYELTFAPDSAGLCIPTTLAIREKGYQIPEGKSIQSKAPWEGSVQVQFKFTPTSGGASNDAFTLSAFGLPEPKGVELPRGNRSPIGFWIAGGLALTFAAFWWKRKRHNRSNAEVAVK